MLNSIWFFLIAASLLYAALTGNLHLLSTAVIDGAKSAVDLSLFTLGSMCVWLGVLHVAETSGFTKLLARLLKGPIQFLFPAYRDDEEINGKICMNITANLLGLGNAATPLGIAAMKAMAAKNDTDRPTKGMILFVVINTASLQLLPVNMAAIRRSAGSVAPFSMLPQIWITSLAALLVCVLFCKGMERRQPWSK